MIAVLWFDRPTTKVTRRRAATWKTENALPAARVDRLVGRLFGVRFIEPFGRRTTFISPTDHQTANNKANRAAVSDFPTSNRVQPPLRLSDLFGLLWFIVLVLIMQTKLIEAVSSKLFNHGKFMLARCDTEFEYLSAVDSRPLLFDRGWDRDSLWVLDLQTGEGACFRPGGCATADLNKHKIWVCPMMEPFLEWLYQQDLDDIGTLPNLVKLSPEADRHCAMSGYRRDGVS